VQETTYESMRLERAAPAGSHGMPTDESAADQPCPFAPRPGRSTRRLLSSAAVLAGTTALLYVLGASGGEAEVRRNLAGRLDGYFVDPASGNLALTPAATGAIDQAEPRSDVPEDIRGRTRPDRPDLGAWELDGKPEAGAAAAVAVPVDDFLNSIGVCSAVSRRGEDLANTVNAVRYLGARWVRAGYESGVPVADLIELHRQTGVRFSYGLMSGGTDIRLADLGRAIHRRLRPDHGESAPEDCFREAV